MLVIGLVFLVLVAVLVAVVASRPARFRVARTAMIAAPPTVVYAQLEDLRTWSQWNPFQKSDPSIQLTYSGPRSGVGASYHFVGRRVGEGRMTLIEALPNERVAITGEFIRPMSATHRIEFVIRPDGKATDLTWSISGEKSFAGKALGLVCNMDQMIGAEFEKGLAHLKFVAESSAMPRTVGA